jgi:diguanylate cyclase (GGDEF)-like protein
MTEGFGVDLQARFRETTRVRLQEMRSHVAKLTKEPSDAAAIAGLTRAFHALAGLGGTYGFPRVSELGDEAESSIARVALPVSDALLKRWREILDAVETELEARAVVVPEPPVSFDVLLVERDAEFAAAVRAALEQERVAVRQCETREEVLAELDYRTPDVLILDVQDSALVEDLRKSAGGENTGIVAVGDAADLSGKVRALRAGANVFLPKPADIPLLVRRVTAFRERRRRAPARVLAVEDDPTQSMILRKVLGDAGYAVTVCSNASNFEDVLAAVAPDLLLMDIHLDTGDSDVSGFDLVRLLRQNEQFSHLPVIFVSGDQERGALLGSAMSGGDTLVSKPVDWALLLSHIASSLERASALRDRTDRDALTGVFTRAAFTARANERLASRGPRPPLVAILDLDHFKQINDTYGHLQGDAVLRALGSCLRRGVRQHQDLAGRYGGEEFVLLLEGISVDDAVKLIERLLAEFSSVEHVPGLKVTFSAGVAVYADSLESTLRRADAALYEAKRAGRARVVPA